MSGNNVKENFDRRMDKLFSEDLKEKKISYILINMIFTLCFIVVFISTVFIVYNYYSKYDNYNETHEIVNVKVVESIN